MAILAYCGSCDQFVSRKKNNCPKCNKSLKRTKKFRVNVKMADGSRKTGISPTLGAAKEIETKWKAEAAEFKHLGRRKPIKMSELWDKYIPWAKEHKKSWKEDKDRWELHIKEHLSDKLMSAVTARDVISVLDSMKAKKTPKGTDYAPATIKQVLVLIKRLFNWAVMQEYYSGLNPAVTVKNPKVNNQVTACLTREEMQRLNLVLDTWKNERAALIVKFALYTGFRLGEVLSLKWDQVDFERKFVHLPDPKGKAAYIPMSDEAMQTIRRAKELLPFPECEFVFPNSEGAKRVSFSKIWERIKDKAKLPHNFRFHDLRHTFASYIASSGKVDSAILQRLLNHQSPQMTQRYAHLLDEAMRRGANVAGEVFSGRNQNG